MYLWKIKMSRDWNVISWMITYCYCFLYLLIHLRPRNTRVIQLYSNNNWLYGTHTLKPVWRSLTILTYCDSISPNTQYTIMANIKKECTNITCDKSMWSSKFYQMKHIFVSCYSVTSSVFEGNRQNHADFNSVEVGLELIKANAS